MKTLKFLVFAVIIIVLSTVMVVAQDEPAELDGTSWLLNAFSTDDELVDALPDTEIIINFADGMITGSAGCNTFFGEYEVDDTNAIVFTAIATTRMACENDVMTQESNFIEALGLATSITIDSNTLFIHYGENVSLVLDKYQVLEGTSWILNAFSTDDELVDALPDTEIIINFVDGMITGSAGCNTFFGEYEVDDSNAIVFTAIATTRMACENDVMAQEGNFIEALGLAISITIDSNTLFIHYGDNISLVLDKYQVLEGTSWILNAFVMDNVLSEVLPDTEIIINFADGQVNGSAGCNTFFGAYEVDGNTISFQGLGTTLMACEEAVMTQESNFNEALGLATSVTTHPNTLFIHYGENSFLVLDSLPAETDSGN